MDRSLLITLEDFAFVVSEFELGGTVDVEALASQTLTLTLSLTLTLTLDLTPTLALTLTLTLTLTGAGGAARGACRRAADRG